MEEKTTVVITGQPITVAPVPQNQREWATGLCSCFEDVGGCCYAYFCCLCYGCKMATKLDESCCVINCVPGGLMAARTKVRTMYGIQGTICSDFCVTTYCGLLALCQMDRELQRCGV